MSKTENYTVRKFGPVRKRRDYSKTVNNLPLNDLVSIQKESFQWFLNHGLEETIQNIYPIESTNGRIRIEYLKNTLRFVFPENEFEIIKESKQKSLSYNFKIYATLRKIDEETAEVKEQEVLFGEIPLMTKGGTFVINGSEKVIISQLLRAPGAYFGKDARSGEHLVNKLELIPKLGMWIDVFHRTTTSKVDPAKVKIDKSKSVSLSTFLRAFGMQKDTILDLFGKTDVMLATIAKDKKATEDEALESIHGVIRKGDRITAESKRNLFANIFFNKKRYDLSKTGRFTINRKLNVVERIVDTILAEDLVTTSGIALFKKGKYIDFEMAKAIQKAFDKKQLPTQDIPDITSEIYGTQLETHKNLSKRTKMIVVKIWPSKEYKDDPENEPVKIIGNDPSSNELYLIVSDIIAAISTFSALSYGLGQSDDPDSLINKKIMSIGELLQNQFQIGLTKLERNAKERMSALEPDKVSPKNTTNNKAIFNQFKSFFNSSQLSQFMDQVNPLAEIANKRRITSLGPGGLNRDTANFEVRDVHSTHYGRICTIETPEGPNIGLILNFANYSRVNKLGFIETAYFKVEKSVVNPKKVIFLDAFQEIGKTFAQSSVKLNASGKIMGTSITARKDGQYTLVKPMEVDYLDVSSKQMTSIASSAIPFLENDDANRALMGANMQRQAVPLLSPEAPLVGTGIEADIAKYAASTLKSETSGVVNYVDSQVIKIKSGLKTHTYQLRSFERSNQGSVITQRPIVSLGQKVKTGDILTDGPSFDKGEMALGKNVVVAFTTWNGYNYEDAIIISERLVKDDVYTSIHIEEQSIQFRKAKAGDDELTREIPNVSNYSKRNLDENGIVIIGSEVEAGDVLVGRVSPKGEDNPASEIKLLSAILSKRYDNQKDTSLKVKHGHGGTVIDVKILTRENGDKLQDGVDKIVRVFTAQKRKIKVGDKMSGRHGNKGIVSKILPIEDMPHLKDGTPVDIMLNPQGVPSRMNIGQVLELHLGAAAKELGVHFATPVFDGAKYQDINIALKEAGLPENGKFELFDPLSGRKFNSEVSVGVMYMLKLAHMIDDKMHARSVGPYSLITQQPLGGKSQNGGQRFGEMETWALEAYGATNVLQEILTYKSDSIEGRNRVYNSLTNGAPLPNPGTPESFNVLKNELLGLGMKLEVENVFDEIEEEKMEVNHG